MARELPERLANEWRGCWPVVHDAAPGIAVAMPLDCEVVRSAHMGSGFWDPFVLDGSRVTVRWVGWNPSRGMVYGKSTWESARGRPLAPQDGWEVPVRGRSRLSHVRSRSSKAVLYFDALPFPPWVGRDPVMTFDRAAELQIAKADQFIGTLPHDVAGCLDIMRAAKSQEPASDAGESNWYRFASDPSQSRQAAWTAAVSVLLGERPTVGISTETAGSRRRQFAQSFPAFSGKLDILLPTIDRGDEIVPHLSRLLGCPEHCGSLRLRLPRSWRNSTA
jgi:hypothetical protein